MKEFKETHLVITLLVSCLTVPEFLPKVMRLFEQEPALAGLVVRLAGSRQKDDQGEQEYVRRTENMPAEQAAAIGLEISDDRKKEEAGPHTLPTASHHGKKGG